MVVRKVEILDVGCHLCVCVCVCACARARACVCVCVWSLAMLRVPIPVWSCLSMTHMKQSPWDSTRRSLKLVPGGGETLFFGIKIPKLSLVTHSIYC
jgi:hypothetical protein